MYEELVKRLRNCASSTWVEDCDGCPYIRYDGTYCINGLITQAADAIEHLERENDFLKSMQRSLTQGRSPEELAYMIHRNMR